MNGNVDLRARWMLSALAAIAVVGAALWLAGCDAFVGPATSEYTCPVFCGRDDAGANVCCSYGLTCSRYADRPCKAPDHIAAARDAGR